MGNKKKMCRMCTVYGFSHPYLSTNVSCFVVVWVSVLCLVLLLLGLVSLVVDFFISSFPPQLHQAASPALLHFLITDTSVPKWKINWGSCHIVNSFRVCYYNYAMSCILNVAQRQILASMYSIPPNLVFVRDDISLQTSSVSEITC